MPQKVVVGRCLAFADLLAKCKSSEVNGIYFRTFEFFQQIRKRETSSHRHLLLPMRNI